MEISGDGHQKVMIKRNFGCVNTPDNKKDKTKKKGRPKKGGTSNRYNSGWYMCVDPRTGRILALEPMEAPENNAVKIKTLERILKLYPNVDTYIHDINCQFMKGA